MAVYLLKVNVLLILFYGFYRLMLGRDTFFSWRRAALLAVYGLSVGLPLINLGGWVQQQEGLAALSDSYTHVFLPSVVVSPEAVTVLSAAHVLFMVWLAGMVVLSVRFLSGLHSILRLAHACPTTEVNGIRVKELRHSESPFSFFRWIFVNPRAQDADSLAEILIHEQAHASQWHSVDIILSELFTIFCFFNPFAWLLRREVRINLEYLADERVIGEGRETKSYQYHLLGLAYHKNVATLSNNFNVLPIKKRIKMMNKKRSNEYGKWKYLLFVPVAAVLLVACNLNNKPRKEAEQTDSVPMTATAGDSVSAVKSSEGKVFDVVEEMPQFPGGSAKLMSYLSSHLQYPAEAQKKKIEGRVVVSFVVETDGAVSGVKVVRSIDPLLDQEAVRVVEDMPRWQPGKQHGKTVRVKYNIPVAFKLQ
ncbi:TonB family protein [Prevotella sp. KH2C16]|uniref:M56 family metallopeptidase n=1 Tax=Prevotella sp. KH2C16 TaxID=1855325 RepID=UPI0008F34033|nr:M56 family metallopeptidase [Prevotella sp. KH2C16]SFG65291.1 TonB family C-terminal domain-containing protein [Prevotella sp. KH2C16]